MSRSTPPRRSRQAAVVADEPDGGAAGEARADHPVESERVGHAGFVDDDEGLGARCRPAQPSNRSVVLATAGTASLTGGTGAPSSSEHPSERSWPRWHGWNAVTRATCPNYERNS